MNDNNNLSLDEMMSNTPRTGITFDATKGVSKEVVETNTPKPNVRLEGKVVQTGPVDFSSTEKIDPRDILPSKSDSELPIVPQSVSDLDAAIDRTLNEIDETLDAIEEKQMEELEDMRLQKDGIGDGPKAIPQETDPVINSGSYSSNDDFGLYDDEADLKATGGTTIPKKESVEEEVFSPTFRFDDDDEEETVEPVQPVAVASYTEPEVEENVKTITVDDSINLEEQVSVSDIPVEEDEDDLKMSLRKVDVSDIDRILGLEDDDADSENDSEEDDDKIVNGMIDNLKEQVKKRIAPIKNKFNLSEFMISKEAISMHKVMKNAAIRSHQHVADWVLYNEGRPISMIGLSGQEIVKLDPRNSNRNRVNTLRDIYRIMYDHIEDANKPEFEAWLKTTRFDDIPHIYFCMHMATFGSANYMNYLCDKCNTTFLKDVKLEDMVKYKNDKAKERVKEILRMDTTSKKGNTYDVKLVQISDNYAFGLKAPSIWNVTIETASLPDEFLEKYSDLIDFISFVDSIYMIDPEHKRLIPVDVKPDPNDQRKTTARKFRAFYDIINSLDTEELYSLRSEIMKFNINNDDISYIIPAAKCTNEKCGADIPAAEDVTPDDILFMRHRLVAAANS